MSVSLPVPLNKTEKGVFNRGFAFVTFANIQEAKKVCKGKKLMGLCSCAGLQLYCCEFVSLCGLV